MATKQGVLNLGLLRPDHIFLRTSYLTLGKGYSNSRIKLLKHPKKYLTKKKLVERIFYN